MKTVIKITKISFYIVSTLSILFIINYLTGNRGRISGWHHRYPVSSYILLYGSIAIFSLFVIYIFRKVKGKLPNKNNKS